MTDIEEQIDPEDAYDIAAAERALARNEETLPESISNALIMGAPTVLVFREYRGISQGELAKLSGVSVEDIAAYESENKTLTLSDAKRLALPLKLEADDLL